MKLPVRLSSRAWLLVPLVACAFILWVGFARSARVEYVTGLAGVAATIDASSATGYTNGVRQLIVPEHNNRSFEWIVQTQQMVAEGSWRLRHVTYDNVPQGREILAASPYRWWLGSLGWIDHTLSSRPIGISIERAALLSDPLLHILFLIGSVIIAAKWFGRFPAAVFAIALATMFPFASSFLSGQPGDHGLLLCCVLWSILPLLVSGNAANDPTSAKLRFCLAGLAAGLGMWIGVGTQLPVVAGIGAGAILAAWFARRTTETAPSRSAATTFWRMWAVAGATTCIGAFALEYFPSHMGGWQLESIHPIYALGWLGAGELIARTAAAIAGEKSKRTWRGIATTTCAFGAVAAVPVVMWMKSTRGFLVPDPLSGRLTNLPNGVEASSFGEWISRDGFTAVAFATCLPLTIVALAAWTIARRSTSASDRSTLIVALGPVAVAFVFAWLQLRWWSGLDAALLALLIASTALISRVSIKRQQTYWLAAVTVALMLVPGFLLLIPRTSAKENAPVTADDVTSLIERDLAQWISNRAGAGRAAVLASPNLTSSLIYYGGVRGIATSYRENKIGLATALRIAGSTAQDEAMALVERRELTHIVLTSWDPLLDNYARISSKQPENSLVTLLHGWTAPRWLRPVPYTLPNIPGFEQQSVKVFEVVELQDNATALGRLAECFLELRRADPAASVSEALERSFPDDVGALVARAMVWSALENTKGFNTAFNALLPLLAKKADDDMLFDRRVSLAIVLAEGKRLDLARAQVQRCVEEMDEMKLRSLTSVALYRLHVLLKAFGQPIVDPMLRQLAASLLPAEMSSEL